MKFQKAINNFLCATKLEQSQWSTLIMNDGGVCHAPCQVWYTTHRVDLNGKYCGAPKQSITVMHPKISLSLSLYAPCWSFWCCSFTTSRDCHEPIFTTHTLLNATTTIPVINATASAHRLWNRTSSAITRRESWETSGCGRQTELNDKVSIGGDGEGLPSVRISSDTSKPPRPPHLSPDALSFHL